MLALFYEDPAVRIFHGDCREYFSELTSVDVVLTDPPYSEHVHSKSRAGDGGPKRSGRGKDNPCSYARTVDFGFEALSTDIRASCANKFAEIARRWVLVFSDVESSHLWRDDLVSSGLEYIRTGAWVKIGATPQFTGDRPAAGFEAITIAHRPGKKRWNGGGSHALWSVPIALDRGGASPRHHPTEKPLELMSRLVSLFSEPGETILDPFAGSGTTGRAAKDLGRKAVLIEAEEKYCEVAAKRMSQEVLSFAEMGG